VIKGWDIGVASMKAGEKAIFTLKSSYGYGEMGSPPKIPGGATLIFTIELLSFHDRRKTKHEMTDEEKIQATLKLKEDGNIKFKNQVFKEAEGLYREAIDHLKAVKHENDEIKNLKKTIYVNIAVTCNKTKDFTAAIQACEKSIQIDDKNSKAYYNRAMAY